MFGWLQKEKTSKVELSVSNQTVIRVLVLVIASFIFLNMLRQAAHAISLIFFAFFLALALNAPVHWFAQQMPGKLRGNRAAATGISFLLIVVVLGGFLASIVPPLVRQTSSFFRAAPGLVEDVRDENSSLGQFIRRNNLEEQVDKFSGELSDRLDNVGGAAVSTASRVGSSVFSTLTVLVLTFMMLVEGPVWAAAFKRLVPKDRRQHTENLLNDMYRVVRGYVNGQVLLATTASLLILVPLFVLDISYPVALMVIVFICGLIPMVGHYIGAAIVTAVALFTSPWDAAIILAYYFLYQQIENYVIQPTIQSNSTNMSPLLVFSSVIVGVSFGGLLGGLVAIPVAGCLRVLMLDYLKSRNYLETSPDAKSHTKPAR
ncbi:MAG TPA: AI-2E family transporter [Candidatus Limnocylindria bacterium]|nr:AI-2E family transporter [Candidatus Limnocylindria bacterium]